MEKQVQITVLRQRSQPDWTLSNFIVNGLNGVVKKGVGVEDEKRDLKVHGETRIPNGIYEIEFVNSPKFTKYFFMDKDGYLNETKTDRFNTPHLLLHVKDVQGFGNILWHWGNTDDQTDGCYLVGTDFATFDKQKGVSASKNKYLDVYPVIYQLYRKNKAEGIKTYVEYKDAA